MLSNQLKDVESWAGKGSKGSTATAASVEARARRDSLKSGEMRTFFPARRLLQ